jgi:hypothetical protein
MNFGGLRLACAAIDAGTRHCKQPNGRRSNPKISIKEAGLLRGGCHRAGHFGPDPLARNDGVLPAHALRTRVAKRSGGDQPIRHPDRELRPADAPRRVGAIPPDPAPAILETYQCVIGAGWGNREPDCQRNKSKGQSFHRGSPYAPSRNAPSRTDINAERSNSPILPSPAYGGRVREGADQAAAARLPKRLRFSFCFSLRGGNLNSRAAVPPRILCLAFSDRNGRSQIVDGRSKSQCG